MAMERIPGNVRRRAEFAGPADLARFFRGDRLETMLRRYLIDAGLLTRDHGIYRRG
jgi:hypothetical protein